ncbi:MAG: DUF4445 domain-containing protein [Syntrophomonadaceae bacterium]|nr:DUF4445 domain-containing protein [Syntrophomonadaceae bacterium]
MPWIYVKRFDIEATQFKMDKGQNLYQGLAENALLDAPCGGAGCCGKCRVRILNADMLWQEREQDFFSAEELRAGWRLACLHFAETDITLELPPEEPASDIISSGYLRDFHIEPVISKSLDSAGNTLVWAGRELVGRETGDSTDRLWGLAIDIGTTTIVASLVDMLSARELASVSCFNGQKAFGQDVMSRIHYAMTNKNGILILQKVLLKDLNHLIREAISRCNSNFPVTGKDIYDITVAGNTTMIHLLAGIDPSSMGKSPYLPAFNGALTLNGDKELGLPVSSHCQVYCLPAVSAFVGGDITAGILACGIHDDPGNILFIDIGTNGEMVLSQKGRLTSCSCAAGPALEGMNISCGVRATPDAIDDVQLKGTGTNTEVEYSVIGDLPAVGLCGSGLLALVAELLRQGILHKSGRLLDHPLVEKAAGKKRFIIDRERGLFLTQQDIRQVQLAKGAILSGIQTMVQANSLSLGEIDQVMIAGQFGAHLKAESLTGTGILPRELKNRIKYVGNTSKSGAYLCLLSGRERETAPKIAQDITYIELTRMPDFESSFARAMQFD